MEIRRRAVELERAGRRIVHMEIGQPDFPAPQPVDRGGNRGAAARADGLHRTRSVCRRSARRSRSFYADRYRSTGRARADRGHGRRFGRFPDRDGRARRPRRRGAHAGPVLPVQPPLRPDVRGQREDDPVGRERALPALARGRAAALGRAHARRDARFAVEPHRHRGAARCARGDRRRGARAPRLSRSSTRSTRG